MRKEALIIQFIWLLFIFAYLPLSKPLPSLLMEPRSPNHSLIQHESNSIQPRPSLETALQTAQNTQEALDRLLKFRSNPSSLPEAPPTIFGTREKAVKVVSRPIDPLQPPRFKVKKVQKPIAEAPAPVMHSHPRLSKLDKEQRKLQSAAWKIPPEIFNRKNPKGFTISLDKRTMRNSLSDRPQSVGDSFGKMAEALAVAEQQALQELEMRSALMRKQAAEEREVKEQQLREMAQKARESLASSSTGNSQTNGLFPQRKLIANAAYPQKDSSVSLNSLHDKRLYDRDAGIESGFVDDEDYSLYDRPLFRESAAKRTRNAFIYTGNAVFRKNDTGEEHYDSEAFTGQRPQPVQFERHDDETNGAFSNSSLHYKEDTFGVESFSYSSKKQEQEVIMFFILFVKPRHNGQECKLGHEKAFGYKKCIEKYSPYFFTLPFPPNSSSSVHNPTRYRPSLAVPTGKCP